MCNCDGPNPWESLPPVAPYILHEDKAMVTLWNQQVEAGARPANHLIIENSLPEPWVGNPRRARVLILRLNPGHDPGIETKDLPGGVLPLPGDAEFFGLPDVPAMVHANLCHEIEDHYHLRPEFGARPLRCGVSNDTTFAGFPGWRFWRCKALKRLCSDLGDERVRRGVAALELFPYHSRSFAFDAQFSSVSMRYTRCLVLDAIESGKVIVVGLARRQWLTLVPELLRYERAVGMVSVAPAVTPANTYMPLAPWLPQAGPGAAYDLIAGALDETA